MPGGHAASACPYTTNAAFVASQQPSAPVPAAARPPETSPQTRTTSQHRTITQPRLRRSPARGADKDKSPPAHSGKCTLKRDENVEGHLATFAWIGAHTGSGLRFCSGESSARGRDAPSTAHRAPHRARGDPWSHSRAAGACLGTLALGGLRAEVDRIPI